MRRSTDFPRRPASRRLRQASGTTLLELVVTTAVLLILASAVLPIAAASHRREREIRLRRALREIRMALNSYHAVCLQSQAAGLPGGRGAGSAGASRVTFTPEDDPDLTCYPKNLEVLIEGVNTSIPRYKLKFIRKIPRDPFNTKDDDYDDFGWRLRSTTQRLDSAAGWNRRNVFDVNSGSEWKALDGSYYKDW